MISRRQIREKVLQAIYSCYIQECEPAVAWEQQLREMSENIRKIEKGSDDHGDSRLIQELFYTTISEKEKFDDWIKSKTPNWEIDRIALIDRILLQMGICEAIHFPEIPVKVTINEILEISKKFSTPKSSRFLNGVLDNLCADLKKQGLIQKSGRGLVDQATPKSAGTKIRKLRPRLKKPEQNHDNRNTYPG